MVDGERTMGAGSSRRSTRLASRQQRSEEERRNQRMEDEVSDPDFEADTQESDDSDEEDAEEANFMLGSDDSDDDRGAIYGVEQFLVTLGGWRRGRLSMLGKRAQQFGPLPENPPPMANDLSQEVYRSTCSESRKRRAGLVQGEDGARNKADVGLKNAAQMLWHRQMNVGGTCHGWDVAQCRHMSGLHYSPNRPISLRARMQSRAYIGRYSHHGNLFVGAFQADKRVRVYDTENEWGVVKDVHARNIRWTITDTCLSKDQQYLLYATITPVVHLVKVSDSNVDSVANVTEIHEGLYLDDVEGEDRGRGDHFGIFSIAWASDNRECVAGTGDFTILIFDMEKAKTVTKIEGHQEDVNAVVFLDDSPHLIVSGSDDHLIKVWDRRVLGRSGNRPAGVLVGHTQGLTHLDSKGDGRYVLSNCKDQTAKVWDVRKMYSHSQFAALPDPCLPRFNWDYRWATFPLRGRDVRHPQDVSVQTFHGHHVATTLIRAYWSPIHTTGQRYVYSASADGAVYIYDTISSKLVDRLSYKQPDNPNAEIIRDASWHPYEQRLVTAGFDGALVEWGYSSEPMSHHLNALPDTGYDNLEDHW